jgi:phosphoribosyl-ATP pyrophosphohydrolase/phosphoribosyl-AMP cyclohydrolase
MLKFDKKGLIPAIIQNAESGKVLMLGYINKESLKKTEQTGHVWFYSRSRQKLWEKGETSGNYLNVRAILKDCDEDTLLIQVDPVGPTCHTGEESCFYRTIDELK